MHLANSAEDGHSSGEHKLYLSLWNSASPDTPDSRRITIGYGGMQDLTGLDRTNCKKNLRNLIQKLSIEILEVFDVRQNQGNTYRVYAPEVILERRRAAGLIYIIRTSGVRLLTSREVQGVMTSTPG